MVKVKYFKKETGETFEDFTDKINEFIKDKEIINIQFLKTKNIIINCFITYLEEIKNWRENNE